LRAASTRERFAYGHAAGPRPFRSKQSGFSYMPSVSRITIALLCAGAFAFACGPRSHSEAASTAALTTAAPVVLQGGLARSSHVSTKIASNFEVKIEDDAVRFALRVTNESKKHIELTFPNGQTHDFVVIDSVGREMWRWGAARLFTQSVQNKLLGGGETLSVNEKWERPARHGKYTAIATLHSSNFPVEERVEFVLP